MHLCCALDGLSVEMGMYTGPGGLLRVRERKGKKIREESKRKRIRRTGSVREKNENAKEKKRYEMRKR